MVTAALLMVAVAGQGATAAAKAVGAPPTACPCTCRGTTTDRHAPRVVACRGGAGVVLYPSSIGGHEWPGRPAPPAVGLALGPVDRSLDADEVIWHFFNTHPLPADPPVRVG